MYEIKCLLFDIGGVLVDWHMSWITSEISKRFEINEDALVSAFSRHLPALDLGQIDEKRFWQRIASDVNSILLQTNTESLWDMYFRKNAKLNHDIINLAKNLKKNSYTLGIISNIEKITHTVVDDWNVLDSFKYKFMSYQIGFSKPDPRIYEHAIERLAFEPNQMIFIDDKEPNVHAAKDFGINAIHFTNFPELRKLLSTYNVSV